jgi:hypothetical protein
MTPASLAIGILAGAVGLGYFIYGKRQAKFVPLVAGVLLCIYPYFLSSVPWMLAIGALLAAAPFLVDF